MTTIIIDNFACPGWARARTSKGRYYTDKKTRAAKVKEILNGETQRET